MEIFVNQICSKCRIIIVGEFFQNSIGKMTLYFSLGFDYFAINLVNKLDAKFLIKSHETYLQINLRCVRKKKINNSSSKRRNKSMEEENERCQRWCSG